MHRSFTFSILAFLLALAIPSAAKADTIETFNFNGTLIGGTVTGTVTIDVTTGKVTGEDFAAAVGKAIYTFDGNAYAQGKGLVAPNDYTAEFLGSFGATFQLGFTTQSLIGYTGGNVCALTGNCNFSTSALGIDPLTSGKLTPLASPAPTPEPSGLVLLGSGLLGVAGMARRKVFV